MRDERFIAVHRGGLLDIQRHRMLAQWAADTAERVLHLFETQSTDPRPRAAIEAARAWGRGEIPTAVAQRAAMAAHRAAREVSAQASAAACAAGHAAGTALTAEHAPGAAVYAVRAIEATGAPAEEERRWQIEQLPEAIQEIVISTLATYRPAVRPPRLVEQAAATS